MSRVWAVFRESDDVQVGGPFETADDADEYCDGWDDVYVSPLPEVTR